jgi:hypothetical protein
MKGHEQIMPVTFRRLDLMFARAAGLEIHDLVNNFHVFRIVNQTLIGAILRVNADPKIFILPQSIVDLEVELGHDVQDVVFFFYFPRRTVRVDRG